MRFCSLVLGLVVGMEQQQVVRPLLLPPEFRPLARTTGRTRTRTRTTLRGGETQALFASSSSNEMLEPPTTVPESVPDASRRKLVLKVSSLSAVLAAVLAAVLGHTKIRGLSQLNPGLMDGIIATLGGLLSSSCCLVQLVLNLFGVSCLGFAALDVWRPLFALLTGSTLVLRHELARRAGRVATTQTVLTALAAVTLTFTPELVKLWNRKWAAPVTSAPFTSAKMHVSGVKCEACAR